MTFEALEASLAERQQAHLLRVRESMQSAQASEVFTAQGKVISFAGNNYLDLANHPKVKQAMLAGVETYGVGSGASQLVCGYSQAHYELEHALAEFTGHERVILFSSGYLANLGAISALTDRKDALIYDRANHASLIDASRISGAKLMRYQHNDLYSLQQCLERTQARRRLVVTEGVFSMDGDTAPLADIAQMAQQYQAWLCVDDAHGMGVLGEHGQGSCYAAKLTAKDITVLTCSFAKAFGCMGAMVAGSQSVIETILQSASSLICTTAMPPALAVAIKAALAIMQTGEQQQLLWDNIAYFREQAQYYEIPLQNSATPIQPLIIGEPDKAVAIQQALLQQGYWVGMMRPPTVPVGTSRLRISITAGHTKQHIDGLIQALKNIIVIRQ